MKAYKSELAERCTKEQLHEAVHGKKLQTKPQTKPLSDEEIKTLHEQTSWFGISDPIKFAKAIELKHGIK